MRAQDAIIEYQKLLGYYDDKSKLLPPRPDSPYEHAKETQRKYSVTDLVSIADELMEAATEANVTI